MKRALLLLALAAAGCGEAVKDDHFANDVRTERAVVGIMRIAGGGSPDGTDGAWVKVPVEPVRPLGPVTLKSIKAEPKLAKMELIRQSRLSVSPVSEEEWAAILAMAEMPVT